MRFYITSCHIVQCTCKRWKRGRFMCQVQGVSCIDAGPLTVGCGKENYNYYYSYPQKYYNNILIVHTFYYTYDILSKFHMCLHSAGFILFCS